MPSLPKLCEPVFYILREPVDYIFYLASRPETGVERATEAPPPVPVHAPAPETPDDTPPGALEPAPEAELEGEPPESASAEESPPEAPDAEAPPEPIPPAGHERAAPDEDGESTEHKEGQAIWDFG